MKGQRHSYHRSTNDVSLVQTAATGDVEGQNCLFAIPRPHLFAFGAVHSKSSISERPHIMRLFVGFEPNGQSKNDTDNAHDQQTYYQIQIHICSHEHAEPENGHLHFSTCESYRGCQRGNMTFGSLNSAVGRR